MSLPRRPPEGLYHTSDSGSAQALSVTSTTGITVLRPTRHPLCSRQRNMMLARGWHAHGRRSFLLLRRCFAQQRLARPDGGGGGDCSPLFSS